MHVAAMAPQYVKVDEIPEEFVAKETEIARAETMENAGNKPENIIERIIEGKISKRLKEICLNDQKFVMDDTLTVEKAAKNNDSEIIEFVRFEVGEGIEVEEKDFAAEVAQQVG